MAACSGERSQCGAQLIGTIAAYRSIDCCVRFLPKWKRFGEQCATCRSDSQTATALVLLVDRNLYQSAAFKKFEGRGQRSAVHGKQISDAANGWRFRPVQRHQQRKLSMGEVERTEHIVEASRQPARGALHVQAQAVVSHQVRGGER